MADVKEPGKQSHQTTESPRRKFQVFARLSPMTKMGGIAFAVCLLFAIAYFFRVWAAVQFTSLQLERVFVAAPAQPPKAKKKPGSHQKKPSGALDANETSWREFHGYLQTRDLPAHRQHLLSRLKQSHMTLQSQRQLREYSQKKISHYKRALSSIDFQTKCAPGSIGQLRRARFLLHHCKAFSKTPQTLARSCIEQLKSNKKEIPRQCHPQGQSARKAQKETLDCLRKTFCIDLRDPVKDELEKSLLEIPWRHAYKFRIFRMRIQEKISLYQSDYRDRVRKEKPPPGYLHAAKRYLQLKKSSREFAALFRVNSLLALVEGLAEKLGWRSTLEELFGTATSKIATLEAAQRKLSNQRRRLRKLELQLAAFRKWSKENDADAIQKNQDEIQKSRNAILEQIKGQSPFKDAQKELQIKAFLDGICSLKAPKNSCEVLGKKEVKIEKGNKVLDGLKASSRNKALEVCKKLGPRQAKHCQSKVGKKGKYPSSFGTFLRQKHNAWVDLRKKADKGGEKRRALIKELSRLSSSETSSFPKKYRELSKLYRQYPAKQRFRRVLKGSSPLRTLEKALAKEQKRRIAKDRLCLELDSSKQPGERSSDRKKCREASSVNDLLDLYALHEARYVAQLARALDRKLEPKIARQLAPMARKSLNLAVAWHRFMRAHAAVEIHQQLKERRKLRTQLEWDLFLSSFFLQRLLLTFCLLLILTLLPMLLLHNQIQELGKAASHGSLWGYTALLCGLSCAGWLYVFNPMGWGASVVRSFLDFDQLSKHSLPLLLHFPKSHAALVVAGFLGWYSYLLAFAKYRSLIQDPNIHSMFAILCKHGLFVLTLVVVLGLSMTPPSSVEIIAAFFIGFFPLSAVASFLSVATKTTSVGKLLGSKAESMGHLPAITRWEIMRLQEEGIEHLSDLARLTHKEQEKTKKKLPRSFHERFDLWVDVAILRVSFQTEDKTPDISASQLGLPQTASGLLAYLALGDTENLPALIQKNVPEWKYTLIHNFDVPEQRFQYAKIDLFVEKAYDLLPSSTRVGLEIFSVYEVQSFDKLARFGDQPEARDKEAQDEAPRVLLESLYSPTKEQSAHSFLEARLLNLFNQTDAQRTRALHQIQQRDFARVWTDLTAQSAPGPEQPKKASASPSRSFVDEEAKSETEEQKEALESFAATPPEPDESKREGRAVDDEPSDSQKIHKWAVKELAAERVRLWVDAAILYVAVGQKAYSTLKGGGCATASEYLARVELGQDHAKILSEPQKAADSASISLPSPSEVKRILERDFLPKSPILRLGKEEAIQALKMDDFLEQAPGILPGFASSDIPILRKLRCDSFEQLGRLYPWELEERAGRAPTERMFLWVDAAALFATAGDGIFKELKKKGIYTSSEFLARVELGKLDVPSIQPQNQMGAQYAQGAGNSVGYADTDGGGDHTQSSWWQKPPPPKPEYLDVQRILEQDFRNLAQEPFAGIQEQFLKKLQRDQLHEQLSSVLPYMTKLDTDLLRALDCHSLRDLATLSRASFEQRDEYTQQKLLNWREIARLFDAVGKSAAESLLKQGHCSMRAALEWLEGPDDVDAKSLQKRELLGLLRVALEQYPAEANDSFRREVHAIFGTTEATAFLLKDGDLRDFSDLIYLSREERDALALAYASRHREAQGADPELTQEECQERDQFRALLIDWCDMAVLRMCTGFSRYLELREAGLGLGIPCWGNGATASRWVAFAESCDLSVLGIEERVGRRIVVSARRLLHAAGLTSRLTRELGHYTQG